MKLADRVDQIIRDLYNGKRCGINNTPSENELFKIIEYEVEFFRIKNVNGNGILRQAKRAEKILKAAR